MNNGHSLVTRSSSDGCFMHGNLDSKRLSAHVFGSRTVHTLRRLLERLSSYHFSFYCTDHWRPYASILPRNKHLIGKLFTQRIERENLNLRTRLKRLVRKTICFSRSIEIHDKIIGEFISREHYQLF